MACFNEVTIGVLTDYEQVDLEKRFQMWGFYLWLDTYKVYARMICERQGDEDLLNLPVSFRSYYVNQSFQVGKKKMDLCLAIGKQLTASRIEHIKQKTSLFHKDTRILAYGLEEDKRRVITGKKRKKTIEEWDGTYFDQVLVCSQTGKDALQETLEKTPVNMISPVLLAEAVLYERAVEKQKLLEEPYILLYSETGREDLLEKARVYAKETESVLLVNDRYTAQKKEVVYSNECLDELYAVLMGAKFVVTDTLVIAQLALSRKQLFAAYPGDADKGFYDFIKENKLKLSLGCLPKDDTERTALRKEINAALKMVQEKRQKAIPLLEDLLGMTKTVDCPTKIRKSECYGCYACKEICPVDAIAMAPDEEGFLYPKVDEKKCIQCGLCKKACIVLENKQHSQGRPSFYAATCKTEEQLESSTSGGVFQSLARYTIEKKQGVVVGVRFNKKVEIVTDIAETMEEAKAFSGSKYAKSDIKDIFPRVKQYLDQDREVLFSGTPCECAGLQAYLQKDYKNLTTCELICHGGASPKVLDKYIKHINRALGAKVTRINFRDKRKSWLQKDFKLTFEFKDREPFTVRGRQNNYMNAFIKDYIFRISCYRCQYAGKHGSADITIGDCHGIMSVNPDMMNKRGVSTIVTSTSKGAELWKNVQEEFIFCKTTEGKAYTKNHRRPSVMTRERAVIFSKLQQTPVNDILTKVNEWKEEKI